MVQKFLKEETTHAVLAKLFRRIARARDPFADKAGYDLALPELNAKAGRRWAERIRRGTLGRAGPLLGVRWADLSDDERDDIRQMARELARNHQSFVGRGMPFKNDQNTLLDGIADIFVDFTRIRASSLRTTPRREQPLHPIRRSCPAPILCPDEASTKALSRRWKRLRTRIAAPYRAIEATRTP